MARADRHKSGRGCEYYRLAIKSNCEHPWSYRNPFSTPFQKCDVVGRHFHQQLRLVFLLIVWFYRSALSQQLDHCMAQAFADQIMGDAVVVPMIIEV